MIHAIVQFITAHAHWAGPLVGLVALTEAIAVAGSFVPGSTILVAVGAAAGAARLSVWPLVAWAVVGAVAGDTLSYGLGLRHGSRLLAMRPFAYRPQWTERARALLARRGDLAVFAGRLLPPLRALMPLLAGMARLPLLRFLLAALLAAVVWAVVHLASGAVIGHWLFHGGNWHDLWHTIAR